MGITIHYHGKITDLDRVEEFEDRVVDMALLSQDNFNDLRERSSNWKTASLAN